MQEIRLYSPPPDVHGRHGASIPIVLDALTHAPKNQSNHVDLVVLLGQSHGLVRQNHFTIFVDTGGVNMRTMIVECEKLSNEHKSPNLICWET